MADLRTVAEYHGQLRSLLPSGPAWDPERVPEIDQVLKSIARELQRIDTRAVELLNEMDPAGVNELVPEWEFVMGLPDRCLGISPAFEERRLAVRRRLVDVGGQTPAFFARLAQSLGYPEARVTEYRAPRFGRSRLGQSHFGTWTAQLMWILESGPRRRLGRRFGASYWGQRFGSNPARSLECVIRRSAPAHGLEFINYGSGM